MKTIGMLSPIERKGKRCIFCNTDKSVKYVVEVDMPSKAPAPFRVYSCNMCVLVKNRQ